MRSDHNHVDVVIASVVVDSPAGGDADATMAIQNAIDEAAKAGNTAKAEEYGSAAEALNIRVGDEVAIR